MTGIEKLVAETKKMTQINTKITHNHHEILIDLKKIIQINSWLIIIYPLPAFWIKLNQIIPLGNIDFPQRILLHAILDK